jgi:glycosyltransferase involved in cell wall biosynthesis
VHLIADGSSDVIDDKAETLYPAVNPARFRLCEGRKDDEFRILFVGNHFFDKGGRELHKAVSLLARDYKVKLVIVANAPAHHSAMFREFVESHQEPWVEWHIGGVPRREIIEKMYPRAHLFVMCSYIDLFGFVFLEAMASGLPVVGCNVHAQKEIIEDGGNGFLVEPPITPFEESMQTRTACAVEKYRKSILDAAIFDQVVVQLKERIAMLIEDEGLWRSMSRRSMELTTSGKFSVQARNKSLVEIYRSSV